ncbi:hypothetical protein M378DRAFT_160309, partial [Amanita muscaria Koide BX008]
MPPSCMAFETPPSNFLQLITPLQVQLAISCGTTPIAHRNDLWLNCDAIRTRVQPAILIALDISHRYSCFPDEALAILYTSRRSRVHEC